MLTALLFSTSAFADEGPPHKGSRGLASIRAPVPTAVSSSSAQG